VGEDMFVKDEPAGGQLSLGANAWKKMFPEAIWPSSIAGTVPVGFFVDQRIRFKTKERGAGSKSSRVIFEGIHELEALVGGTFGERFSFFGDPKVWEGTTDSTEIGRLFIQYNRSPQMNLRFGIIEPRAIGPFSKHRQWIRMEEHLFNKTPTISPGGMDLAKFSFRKSEGFEFYGAKEFGRHGIEYAAGLLSGKDWQSSRDSVGRDGGSSSWREIDSDKDWYVSLAWKIGGMGVVGKEEDSEELVMTDNWQDNSVKIGAFYYNGRTDVPVGFAGNVAPKIGSNHFIRTGITLDLFYGDANIMAGAQFMRNRARDWEAPFDHKDFDAMIYEVELDYVVYPWLLPAIRWVLFDPSNYDGGSSGDDNGFQQVTANLSLLGAANIKMMLEGTTKFDNETKGRQEEYRVSFNWTF
jgi:hypothetical protein